MRVGSVVVLVWQDSDRLAARQPVDLWPAGRGRVVLLIAAHRVMLPVPGHSCMLLTQYQLFSDAADARSLSNAADA